MKKLSYSNLKSIYFPTILTISLVFPVVLLSLSAKGVGKNGVAAIIVNCTKTEVTGYKSNNLINETFTLKPSQNTVIGSVDGDDINMFSYNAHITCDSSKTSIMAQGTSKPIVHNDSNSKVNVSYTSQTCPSYEGSNPYTLYIDVFSDSSFQNCPKDLGCNTVNNLMRNSPDLTGVKRSSALYKKK
ncbi:MAG: hypothetical protein K2P93_05845 [Alphaproteobacteria bacterium]|nr:hypothetical protein [Alphaproteobacteria bacterium]